MTGKNIISDYLSQTELDKISELIYNYELKTSGELRLCVKKKRGYFEKDFSPRDLAINEFFKLKMNETSDGTGVLFFIIFDEHKFEIIADKGINAKIPDEKWNDFSEGIKERFSGGKYYEGIVYMINSVGDILIHEFPVKTDDKNELSNEIVIN